MLDKYKIKMSGQIALTITPINLRKPSTEYGKVAKKDYLRERDNLSKNFTENCKWDDSDKNNSIIGDYFGFVHNVENKVEIFKIIDIKRADTRPDYWNLPNHKKRNVLILGPKIKDITFSELKSIKKYKDNYILRGTSKINISKNILA